MANSWNSNNCVHLSVRHRGFQVEAEHENSPVTQLQVDPFVYHGYHRVLLLDMGGEKFYWSLLIAHELEEIMYRSLFCPVIGVSAGRNIFLQTFATVQAVFPRSHPSFRAPGGRAEKQGRMATHR